MMDHHWAIVRGAVCAALVGTGLSSAMADPGDDVVPAAHADDGDGPGKSPFDQTRMVRELMRRRGGDPAAAAQAIQLTRSLPPADAAELFETLADAHMAAGSLDLAAETRRLLLDQYPNEPAAAAAKLWLVRLYASGEVTHAQRQGAVAAGRAADDGAVDRGFAQYALNFAGSLADSANGKPRDPALTYQSAVAARRAGQPKVADALLTPLKHGRVGDAWGDCARTETWLAEGREGESPKPVARCVAAAQQPNLDGVLDESCWQREAAMRLGTAPSGQDSDASAATVQLAYDRKFLYVALACPQLAGVAYPRDERSRVRDADLAEFDRVRLLLDADRDYASWFALSADSRGWTLDRCWADVAWNPRWFVAVGGGAGSDAWTVEAAVPWTALTARPPQAGDAWSVAADRTAPGAAANSWLAPSGDEPGPACFGLLLFE